MNYFNEAKEKLDRELKSGSFDKYGNAMKSAVHQALLDFCRQSEEFSGKVINGSSFEECMNYVAKGVKGGSISDLEAYKRAVKYYWKNADVRVQMEIIPKNAPGSLNVDDQKAKTTDPKGKSEIIDLSAFL